MRQLAYIETIKSLEPIPGADKIEKATVLGWELVVQKNVYNVGDKVIYVEIDSILPELPPFEFLRPKKFRIKTIKLRGAVSQGICFPLSVIKEVNPDFDLSALKVGQDVTEILKIVKHDPEAALDRVYDTTLPLTWWQKKVRFLRWKLFGIKPVSSGNFPNNVPRTDEERVQKMGSALEKRQGELCYITTKCEGTSSTFVYEKNFGNWFSRLFHLNGRFLVCSRNRTVFNSHKRSKAETLGIAPGSTHHIVQVARRYDLENKLRKLGRNLAIQGECVGPKIQANPYRLPDLDLRVFLIWDIDEQKYLPFTEMQGMCAALGLPMVPIVDPIHVLKNDIKYYVELSKGKHIDPASPVSGKIDREGIVIRSLEDNFSFKAINPEYLLKQELANKDD